MAFLATVSLIAVESLLILNSGERRRKDLKGMDTEQLSAFLWHLIHGWIRLGTDCRPHLDCNLSNDLISILFALFINFRDRSGRGNSMNKRYICQLDQFYSFSRAPPFLRSFGLFIDTSFTMGILQLSIKYALNIIRRTSYVNIHVNNKLIKNCFSRQRLHI